MMLLVMKEFASTETNAFLEHAGGLDWLGNKLLHCGYRQALSALRVDTAEAANLYFITYISHDAWDMFAPSLNCSGTNKVNFSAGGIVPTIKSLKERLSTAGFWQCMEQVQLLHVSNFMAENAQAVAAIFVVVQCPVGIGCTDDTQLAILPIHNFIQLILYSFIIFFRMHASGNTCPNHVHPCGGLYINRIAVRHALAESPLQWLSTHYLVFNL
jgi:hypothetical protein